MPVDNFRTLREPCGSVDIVCNACGHKLRLSSEHYHEWSLLRFDRAANHLRDNCPGCLEPYDIWESTSADDIDREMFPYGKTVAAVIATRSQVAVTDLVANLDFVLAYRLKRAGLKKLSQEEKYCLAVMGMVREVNNGGFDQFFWNSSGSFAMLLVPALRSIGSVSVLKVAIEALHRFGKPKSLSIRERTKHLSILTQDGELSLWEDLNDAFYASDEDIDWLLLEYVVNNIESFQSE